MNLLKQWKTES